MGPLGANAVAAVVGGLLVAVLAFVPEVAFRYRRAGRLGVSDLVALVVVPIYGLALWTYTLLPLPDPDDVVCKAAQTEPFHSIAEIRRSGVDSLASIATNWMLAQVVLNVLLFVPFGFILRWRYRRGVVVAVLAGFATSLLIETTQLTGIWGVYSCAYRYFDVDDLITNTTGALVGSVLAWAVLRHRPPRAVRSEDRMITAGQRVVATVSDVLFMLLLGIASVVAWRAVQAEAFGRTGAEVALGPQRSIQWGVPFAVEAVAVLARGHTIGEWAVRLGTTAPARWVVPGRAMKLLFGPGLLVALGWWESPWSALAGVVAVVVVLVAASRTREHRGLANAIAGLRPVVLARHEPGAADRGTD